METQHTMQPLLVTVPVGSMLLSEEGAKSAGGTVSVAELGGAGREKPRTLTGGLGVGPVALSGRDASTCRTYKVARVDERG